MWRTGIFKDAGRTGRSFRQCGFTLMELLVVIAILSIAVTFVIPRMIGREEAELKSSVRRVLYAARRSSDYAVFRKEKRLLYIDLDSEEYWEGEEGKKNRLPRGVSFREVLIGKEEVRKGRTFITFFPSGLRDEARITIEAKGKGYSVIVPVLGERFEISD